MRIEVEEQVGGPEWDRIVNEWQTATIFHRSGWLEAAARFSGHPLVRLLGRVDTETVVAMPCFAARTGPLRTCLSPPPKLGIPYLGPLLRDDLASRKREVLRLEVLQAVLKELASRFHPAILYFRTVPALTDARAFRWDGCTAEALYTYLVRLPENLEELLPTFHRTVRTTLRKTERRVDVRTGGKDLCEDIHGFVADRFRRQGKEFGPPKDYLSTLFDALGPSAYQPIGAYADGELAAGAIVTFHRSRAAFWQHASAPSSSRLPLTDYMIWYAMKLASERGATEFELVGANTPRLVNFKSKFAPDLEQFFEVSKTTATGKIARELYRHLRA